MALSAVQDSSKRGQQPPSMSLWTQLSTQPKTSSDSPALTLWQPTQNFAPTGPNFWRCEPHLGLRQQNRATPAAIAAPRPALASQPASHPPVLSRADTLGAFWRLLRTETSYRTVILARSLHSVGNGVMIGAFTFLLTQVGKNNVSKSFLASAALTFIEVQIFGLTNYNSAHNSDKVAGENGRLDDAAKIVRRQAYLKKLFWTVGADVLVGAGMLGVSVCVGSPWASVYALGAVLTAARLLQTFKGHVEAGLFLNLRQSDPKPQVMGTIRGQENKFRQLEVALSATANTLASVLIQYVLFAGFPAAAPLGVAIGIAVGTAVSLSPKVYAYYHLKA